MGASPGHPPQLFFRQYFGEVGGPSLPRAPSGPLRGLFTLSLGTSHLREACAGLGLVVSGAGLPTHSLCAPAVSESQGSWSRKGSANVFGKKSDGKYFKLCSHMVSRNCSTFPQKEGPKNSQKCMNKCASTALFTETGSGWDVT